MGSQVGNPAGFSLLQYICEDGGNEIAEDKRLIVRQYLLWDRGGAAPLDRRVGAALLRLRWMIAPGTTLKRSMGIPPSPARHSRMARISSPRLASRPRTAERMFRASMLMPRTSRMPWSPSQPEARTWASNLRRWIMALRREVSQLALRDALGGDLSCAWLFVHGVR